MPTIGAGKLAAEELLDNTVSVLTKTNSPIDTSPAPRHLRDRFNLLNTHPSLIVYAFKYI